MMEHIIVRHSPWCNTWGNIHTYLKDRNTVLMHVKCIITVIPHDHKSPATQLNSLAFVRGIHLWLVHSPHKWPVTQKMFPFDYITMYSPAFCNQTSMLPFYTMFSTSKPKQNGWHFADYVFKFVLLVCKILYFNSSFTETWSKWSI